MVHADAGSKGTTINDLGGPEEIKKKNFGGPSPGKKVDGLPPGKKILERLSGGKKINSSSPGLPQNH